ncbi:unnamed protein product [Mortierella alpina]
MGTRDMAENALSLIKKKIWRSYGVFYHSVPSVRSSLLSFWSLSLVSLSGLFACRRPFLPICTLSSFLSPIPDLPRIEHPRTRPRFSNSVFADPRALQLCSVPPQLQDFY